MSDLLKGSGTMSIEKAELFDRLLRKKRIDVPRSQTITRRQAQGPCQLSFAQQRLWFLDQLEPGRILYNIHIALRISGLLNLTALGQSFDEILRRHEALRTTFSIVDDVPVQVIAPPSRLELPVLDLSASTGADSESELRRLTTEEAQRPFDLARGPLFRAALLKLKDKEHVLLVTMHHIVSDGWSMSVFMRELKVLYKAFSEGKPSPLAELPIQYADFARWQHQHLSGEVLEGHLEYWKRQLAAAPALLDLPTDRPRPLEQRFQGARQTLTLSKSVSDGLKVLSQREGVTLFNTLLAVYQLLLSRYARQEDVSVGAAIGNRTHAETEGLIGFFVNTLVMRTDLSGNPSFRELLQRVKEMTLGALEHQELPFEKLVEELQPERSLSRSPFFQVMFIFQNTPVASLALTDLSLKPLNFDRGITPVRSDLDLYMGESAEGLRGYFMYSTDLFDASTMLRMSERFRLLTESLVRNPDVAIADLEIKDEINLPGLTEVVEAEEKVKLSSHQERLWFIDQFETGNVYKASPVYHNIPLILHFRGSLDIDLLESSINAVVGRHAALRTRIATDHDQGLQLISSHEELRLEVMEIADSIKSASVGDLMELALDEARRPFVLEGDLLVRGKLFRRSADESVLVITLHHIIADKRSVEIITAELSEIYEARLVGREPRLASLGLQYPDYSQWQRRLSRAELEPLLFYWKWQLRGRLQVLELPEDHPRPAVHTYINACQTFRLEKDLTQRLEALGRESNCDLFELVLAGFKALLHRYSKQDEIVVGISGPCRTQPGTENVVGPMANLLVLRSSLGGQQTYRSFLAQVKQTVRQARLHQEMPFDKLVQELKPENDMSRTALFDVLFQFDDREQVSLGFGAAEARVIETNLGYGKYDLNLAMERNAAGLSGTMVYNADIYEGTTIEQMIGHFEAMLEEMTAHPDGQIDDVNLLSRNEEQQQLEVWNATQASYPKEKTITQLFAEQVERTPEAVAVVFNEEQVSYRELNERANQLAHYLQSRGVAADTLVGLCLNKSVEMIVAMLATLKAGGAYLPMDPAYPQERLRFMVEDSKVAYLLTTESLVESVPQKIPTTILLDAERERIKTQPQTAPDNNCSPNNLIYCIYTSGSTGKPKGVLLEHRNVVRLMVNDQQPFSFTEKDVWTMFHSYCFDFSVWEMYGALLYGGKLVIVPEPVMKDPSLFLELLVKQKVTVLNQTPTAFYNLTTEALKSASPKLALRYVIFGGEALHPVQLKEWKHAYPGTKLINMYGITETTVHVTFKEITDREIEENRSNIGNPIPTTTTYVMDAKLRLLPVGVAGEICVGGEGVGRGYLGRDELTRQKFVANPYRPEERLYRSGDLAKLLPDGELLYLGRIDDQVQIRGFRVEPGEIKSHLLEHPLVAEAEVVARESKSESLELVAYVVPRAEVSVTALRSHLAETLPFYMVPTAFVMLDSLPLTANGKVDRKALPDPDETRPEIEETFVAPRTASETVLSKIWAEILGLEQVGVFDNFFELGGHSLLATRVASRVREEFQVELPLRTLFEQPTIAGLALMIPPHKVERAGKVELADLLAELQDISDEEAERLLSVETRPGDKIRIDASSADGF
jgi:amino acid adenylation domain-containing protein